MNRRRARPPRWTVWPLVAIALGACATNPVTGGADFVMLSEAQEIELGRVNDPKVRAQFGVYEDVKLQAYVQRVGERVAANSHRPDLIYRFAVLDAPEVNAFALPGGYIYITRGLLAYLNSEAELAAVLGHELGHVTARHSVRQYSAATAGQLLATIFLRTQAGQSLFNVIGNALLSGYGRDQELEADRLGAEYLARNGYDPDAITQVLEVLKNQEEFEKERAKAEGREPRIYHGVFATHPSADQRLQEVVAEAKRGRTPTEYRLGREEFLSHIDGLVFGDSTKNGVRRGAAFYHRDLDFAVHFPEAWSVENTAEAVTAQSPARDALLQLRTEVLNKRVPPEEYLKARFKLERIEQAQPVAGLEVPSLTGTAHLQTPFGRRPTRVSVVLRRDRAFLLLATARTDAGFAQHDAAFLAVARSFHALTPRERRFAEGLRLRVAPAAGDTFARLAQRSAVPNYAELVLRLINDKYPTGEPTAGEPIKTIQ